MALAAVTTAKYGTVQLPVINGLPAKLAVDGLPVVGTMVSETVAPVIVKYRVSTEEELVLMAEAVCALITGVTPWALALARALDNPAGEHPTKSGAVSFTAAHSCLLN